MYVQYTMKQVLVFALFVAAVSASCTVSPISSDSVFISDCSYVTLEFLNGAIETGEPGIYELGESFGCQVIIVNGEVYKFCGQSVTPIDCTEYEDLAVPEWAARACALDTSIKCQEECCAPECCVEKENALVSTWAGHEWDDFVGTDGISIVPSDGRVRVEGSKLIGSCSLPQDQCHIGCLLGEPMVATREIFVPMCDPTTVTVKIIVESVSPGATATLGNFAPVDLVVGENILLGFEGPLVISLPLPPCSSDPGFVITAIDVDTTCVNKIDKPVKCQVSIIFSFPPERRHSPFPRF